MPSGATGTRVIDCAPGSPASRVLRPNDVLLSIAGHAIADNGTVEFRPRERTQYSLYVEERQLGDRLPLTIWRDGADQSVEAVLDWPWPCGRLVRAQEHEQRPRYFMFGGLAFGVVDWNYLTTTPSWPEGTPARFGLWAETPDQEPVILIKVFSAAVNQGYDDMANRIITAVDDTKPRNLAEFVRLIEAGTGEFVRLTDVEGQQIVLNRKQAVEQGPKILATYDLPADRSAELVPRDYLSARGATAPAVAASRPAAARKGEWRRDAGIGPPRQDE
jgi:hypothetical protein